MDLTATLLRHPGGRILVVVTGLLLIGAGLFLAFQAWRERSARPNSPAGSSWPARGSKAAS